MKPAALFLTASLAANVALVGLLVVPRHASAPASSAKPTAVSAKASALTADALRAALASGDTTALAAAGFSPEAIRELTVGRSLVRALERARAAKAGTGDGRWWRTNRANPFAAREQQLQARREITEALAAAGLEDPGLFTPTDNAQLFAFLSPDKRDALRRITQDYDELMLQYTSGGIQLASDREKLKLLRAERDRDIAALLSPAEREAYELRTSSTAANVRARYGDAIETEEDFRKIYALQKAIDDKYPADATGRITMENVRLRNEAQRQLMEDIRAAVGDTAYASLQRASDYDLRNLDSLASRLQLPTGTTDRVAASRESFAAESQRINADTSLSVAQRREQIQALGNRAKSEITQALGQEAADAYAQRSGWVGMLQNGMAYGTPQTGSGGVGPMANAGGSVYPVPPGGATGNVRQSFTVAAPIGGGDFVGVSDGTLLGGGGTVVEGGRVMTFSSSETTTTAPAGGGTTTRVITAPRTDAVATPPPKK